MNRLIILAAGQGTRLRPITDKIPKALILVDGENTILRHLIFHFEKWADEILVVTGYKGDRIIDYLNYDKTITIPSRFIHNKEYYRTNSMYSAYLTQEFWAKSDEIIFSNCDVVFRNDALKNFLESSHPITLAIDPKECDHEDMKVTVDYNNMLIKRVSKQIDNDIAYGEFTGLTKIKFESVGLVRESFAELLKKRDMHKNGWYDLVFDYIAQNWQPLPFVELGSDSYVEIDTHEDLIEAREKIKQFK